jgi:uncharacterized membrane-anchored protein YitT (DUF2179 family)
MNSMIDIIYFWCALAQCRHMHHDILGVIASREIAQIKPKLWKWWLETRVDFYLPFFFSCLVHFFFILSTFLFYFTGLHSQKQTAVCKLMKFTKFHCMWIMSMVSLIMRLKVINFVENAWNFMHLKVIITRSNQKLQRKKKSNWEKIVHYPNLPMIKYNIARC